MRSLAWWIIRANLFQAVIDGAMVRDLDFRLPVSLQIEIYRLEQEHEWTLEVVDQEGTSTVWDDTFSSEEAAMEEALRCLREEGPQAFSGGKVIPFRR